MVPRAPAAISSGRWISLPVKIDRCEKRRTRSMVKSRSPPESFTPAIIPG